MITIVLILAIVNMFVNIYLFLKLEGYQLEIGWLRTFWQEKIYGISFTLWHGISGRVYEIPLIPEPKDDYDKRKE
jgi:hypothetical protein